MAKRLYRSRTNKVISGVCGGIAEYFNIDPSLVRLGMVLFTFAGGSGIVAYIIGAIVIPQAPHFPPGGSDDWYNQDFNQGNGPPM
ncbi:MAG: PspC domain-containing protein [Defluviitaleaceae bacterium]|nr:PspC domain-containing protein [Defluviitaleaceae bacterium]